MGPMLIVVAAFFAPLAHAQPAEARSDVARCMALLPRNARPGVMEDWKEALACMEANDEKWKAREREAARRLWGDPATPASPSRQQIEDRASWESAFLNRTEDTGDSSIKQCFYTALGGYRFSINSRYLCAHMVQVNPETNQVRK